MTILATGQTFISLTIALPANCLSFANSAALSDATVANNSSIFEHYPDQTAGQFCAPHASTVHGLRSFQPNLLTFIAEHSLAVKAIMVGAVLAAGLAYDANQISGFEITPVLAGLGSFFSKIFGGDTEIPSDRKISKIATSIEKHLSDRTAKTSYQNLGHGEEMERNDLIRKLLTIGIGEDEVVLALSKLFERCGKNMAQVFRVACQLADAKGTVAENGRKIHFITETAHRMGEWTPKAFEAVPKLLSGGLTLLDISCLFECAGEYRSEGSFEKLLARAAKELGGKFSEACGSFIEQIEREEARRAESLAFAASFSAREARVTSAALVGNDPEVEKAEALLSEVRQIAARITRAENRDLVYNDVVSRLEEMYDNIRKIFEDIENGQTLKFKQPKEVIGKYALSWLITAYNLHKYYLPHNPGLARKLLWGSIHRMNDVMPMWHLKEVLNYFDNGLGKIIEDYYTRKSRHISKNDFSDIENGDYERFLGELIEKGLLATGGQYESKLPPPEEKWPDGDSPYVREVLQPLFNKGLERKSRNGRVLTELFKQVFSKVFEEYQRLQAGYPSMPFDVVLCTILRKLNFSSIDLIEEGITPNLVGTKFYNMHRGLNRALAIFSSEIFDRFKVQINRDFPLAIYYRDGLEQEIDKEALEQALRFPDDGEDVIMHIGVDGDLEFVKESLRHLSANGKVVIVDNDDEALKPFYDDFETDVAQKSGKLIIEQIDAFEDAGFMKKYGCKVNRVYLLHPNGRPIEALEKIVSQNGIVIWQTDEIPPNSRGWILREMQMIGFEKNAGYANGYPWFNTDTAMKLLNGVGIYFYVGRRRDIIFRPTQPKMNIHFTFTDRDDTDASF